MLSFHLSNPANVNVVFNEYVSPTNSMPLQLYSKLFIFGITWVVSNLFIIKNSKHYDIFISMHFFIICGEFGLFCPSTLFQTNKNVTIRKVRNSHSIEVLKGYVWERFDFTKKIPRSWYAIISPISRYHKDML